MRINHFNTSEQPLVIAEIGNNHEGDVAMARRLVRQAAVCGAQAVKFQTFRTERFANPCDAERYERMKRFELAQDEFRELHDLARSLNLLFLSTPLDLESAHFLVPLVDAFKIASGDNNFYPLLEVVAGSGKPVIISTGVSDWQQIHQSKSFIENQWQQKQHVGELAVLHCVSNYPVADENANLAVISQMQQQLDCEIGYSDHTIGLDACMIAVALGARIIEKHFTLDHNYSDFRDHQMSADPPELTELVDKVAKTGRLMGGPDKCILESEADVQPVLRRSIVAAHPMESGHEVTSDDLMWLRPADGLAPGSETLVLGKKLNRALSTGEAIQLKDVA